MRRRSQLLQQLCQGLPVLHALPCHSCVDFDVHRERPGSHAAPCGLGLQQLYMKVLPHYRGELVLQALCLVARPNAAHHQDSRLQRLRQYVERAPHDNALTHVGDAQPTGTRSRQHRRANKCAVAIGVRLHDCEHGRTVARSRLHSPVIAAQGTGRNLSPQGP